MDAELKLLGAGVLVGIVQLLWAAGAARGQQDLTWAAGPRDTPMPITGVAARLDRAFKNYMETFPLFAAALLAAVQPAPTQAVLHRYVLSTPRLWSVKRLRLKPQQSPALPQC